MTRQRLPGFDYASSDVLYFVTIRAHPGMSPFTDHRLAQAVLDDLHWLRANRGVKIFAWCVMPDHVHLLLQLGEGSGELGRVIGSMKRFVTERYWKLGYQGILWQQRFHDRILREDEDPMGVARYTVENARRKGLVAEGEEWRWSGMLDEW